MYILFIYICMNIFTVIFTNIITNTFTDTFTNTIRAHSWPTLNLMTEHPSARGLMCVVQSVRNGVPNCVRKGICKDVRKDVRTYQNRKHWLEY